MKILGVADIHGSSRALTTLGDLGEAVQVDLVLLAGDICADRRYCRFVELLPELAKQLQCPIVLTPGNQDYFPPERFPYKPTISGTDIVTLVEQTTCFNGFNIYGSPYTLRTSMTEVWKWNWTKPDLQWEKIPKDTHILLTHCPPYGYGDRTFYDRHNGSEELRQRLDELPELVVHLYGHIHEDFGFRYNYRPNCLLANVSCCDRHCDLQPPGILIADVVHNSETCNLPSNDSLLYFQ